MIGFIVAVCVIIILILVLFPFSTGKLPHSRFHNGISERIKLEIDKDTLGLMLLSDDISNPVLLVCGGGPGIPQFLLEYTYSSPLSDEFTVCYWDYRGTGASFSVDIIPENMTTERFVNDAAAVTDYLLQRFSQEKIFIMGHSFGTYIALKTVQVNPDKYECYIAVSQVCDQMKSEYIAFDHMQKQYERSGSIRMVRKFQKYDIRSSAKDYYDYFFSGLRDKAMHDLGLGTMRSMHSVISGIFLPSLRCTAYTQKERINIWRGKGLSSDFPVTQDAIVNFNAFVDVPELKIPVYFIVGEHDYTCCASLQKEYCESINAPKKKIYIFENSAHSPIYEEYQRGKEVIAEIKKEINDGNCICLCHEHNG